MFTKLELRNFQSHESTELEFVPGVNAIIGASDSGKTAILRAIRWVIWNRPLGDAFRSDWGGDTSITIQVPENTITRWKYDNEHGYTVNGTKLTAIKTEVPEDVGRILNIDEINLQQQFDRPFLIDASAGEVANHFNKVAHLDNIGITIKTLTSWQRKLNQDVQVYESKIEGYEKNVRQYDFIPDMEVMIEQAEKYQDEIETLTKEMMELNKIVDSLEEIELQIEELAPILKLEKSVKEYLLLRDEKISLETSKDELYSIIFEMNVSFHVLTELKAIQTKETSVNDAINLYQTIESNHNIKKDLNQLILRIKETKEDLYNTTKEVDTLQKEFNNMFPDICPLCGNRKEGK